MKPIVKSKLNKLFVIFVAIPNTITIILGIIILFHFGIQPSEIKINYFILFWLLNMLLIIINILIMAIFKPIFFTNIMKFIK